MFCLFDILQVKKCWKKPKVKKKTDQQVEEDHQEHQEIKEIVKNKKRAKEEPEKGQKNEKQEFLRGLQDKFQFFKAKTSFLNQTK